MLFIFHQWFENRLLLFHLQCSDAAIDSQSGALDSE